MATNSVYVHKNLSGVWMILPHPQTLSPDQVVSIHIKKNWRVSVAAYIHTYIGFAKEGFYVGALFDVHMWCWLEKFNIGVI